MEMIRRSSIYVARQRRVSEAPYMWYTVRDSHHDGNTEAGFAKLEGKVQAGTMQEDV